MLNNTDFANYCKKISKSGRFSVFFCTKTLAFVTLPQYNSCIPVISEGGECVKGILKRVLPGLLATMMLASGAQAAVDATVIRNNLPIFDSATYSKDTYLGTLKEGTEVSVLEVKGSWARIEMDGNIGFTGSSCLTRLNEISSMKGWATKKITVYRSASKSSKKLGTASKGSSMNVIGVCGKFLKVENPSNGAIGYVLEKYMSKKAPSSSNSGQSTLEKNKASVIKLDWYKDGTSLYNKGSYYSIYDIRSGSLIRVKYTLGSDHMDLEPATAEDTAKLKKACGGSWTYKRRSVILIAEGKSVAASIYCEPHGSDDTISGNNMEGVICLHMTNSRTHGSNQVDSDHQAAVNAAYAWARG